MQALFVAFCVLLCVLCSTTSLHHHSSHLGILKQNYIMAMDDNDGDHGLYARGPMCDDEDIDEGLERHVFDVYSQVIECFQRN
jgi:hypothetical protein